MFTMVVKDQEKLKERDFSLSLMGKVKKVSSIPNLYIILTKECFSSVKLTYLGGLWVLIQLDSSVSKEKFLKHVGVGSWFSSLKHACNSFISDERIVWISLEGLPINAWTTNTFSKVASMWGDLMTKIGTIINESFKVILRGKVYWVRAKELDAWTPKFLGDNLESSSSDDESTDNDEGRKYEEKEHENINEDNEVDRVSESRCMREHILKNHCEETSQSKDPFNIYELLNKKKEKVNQSNASDPTFPLGFAPDIIKNDMAKEDDVTHKQENSNSKQERTKEHIMRRTQDYTSQRSSSMAIVGGSILEVMDDLIKVGQTMSYNIEGLGYKAKKGWIKELCLKHRINFVALQETKMESIDLFSIKSLWGNFTFEYATSSSAGNSGGILCVWDPNMFVKDHVSSCDYFLAIMGTWSPTSTKLLIICVYAPQELAEKMELWGYIRSMIDRWEGETVILGDFNEVRTKQERFGSVFNAQGASVFNNFISMTNLIDLPLGGYSYTWAHKTATKMSKLDRFLISEGLLVLFPYLMGLCLDRHLSDHRPIVMNESFLDYGPTPFRMFHYWFKMERFDKFVEKSWKSMNLIESNVMICLKKKFQLLKYTIKDWSKENKAKLNVTKGDVQKKLSEVDKILDQNGGNADLLNHRSSLLKDLQEFNSIEFLELSQKAKVCWAIEGDENSKYFHEILNNKRSQLAICGILVDEDWIVDPIEDLECVISYDEIKKEVWECGNNKSSGPDGFSFEFIRKIWSLIDNDVVAAISEFFASGKFPPGCNSSFIALIPKIQDAKVVKDYRPISNVLKVSRRTKAQRGSMSLEARRIPKRGIHKYESH
ncbi:RNA-directed DNA polymerase, eukaryota [Tanacetum coccineum]